jgi:RNA polymerase sigma-70 factor (ECF subfamily)
VVNACLDEERRRRFPSHSTHSEPEKELTSRGWPDEGEHGRQLEAITQRGIQEEQCSQLEISTAVQAAVKDLSPKLRMAILLKYFEGSHMEAMARVLDCSIGTVASRLNRGHKQFARKLAHLKL